MPGKHTKSLDTIPNANDVEHRSLTVFFEPFGGSGPHRCLRRPIRGNYMLKITERRDSSQRAPRAMAIPANQVLSDDSKQSCIIVLHLP